VGFPSCEWPDWIQLPWLLPEQSQVAARAYSSFVHYLALIILLHRIALRVLAGQILDKWRRVNPTSVPLWEYITYFMSPLCQPYACRGLLCVRNKILTPTFLQIKRLFSMLTRHTPWSFIAKGKDFPSSYHNNHKTHFIPFWEAPWYPKEKLHRIPHLCSQPISSPWREFHWPDCSTVPITHVSERILNRLRPRPIFWWMDRRRRMA